VTLLGYIIFLCFPALLILAAVFDLMTMTIPNRLCLALLAVFPVAAWTAGLPLPVAGWHALAGVGVLALGFCMFAFGWVGGGDAKMAAVVALWLGPDVLLEWALLSAALGGALTIVLLGVRRFPLPLALAGQGWISRLHHHETGVPYGIALAAGGLMVYPAADIFAALAV
jgi:prepilin peptidase CpaA